MGYEARKAAGADEALGEAARNLRAAGDQLDDMLEFVRLVHRVRRAKPPVADDER
jgi:hypothetical protein